MALDRSRLQKPARKLRKLLKKMPKSPGVDDIHDFRTNSRRLETMLEAFALDRKGNGRRLSKDVSKLRKRAGKIRDMDVLTDYVAKMAQPESERECAVRLLEYLGAQRKKQVKKFQSARKQYISKLRRRLQRTQRKIENTLPPNGNGQLKGEPVPAKVAASAFVMLSKLREPLKLGRTNLHPYRLKVKELRNLLQMAEGADHEEFVDGLGEVKDAIGEWHDWEVLATIAKGILRHGRNCQVLHALHTTAGNKYGKALSLAQTMRREFLRLPSEGRKTGSGRARRPSQAVWSAAAALAA